MCGPATAGPPFRTDDPEPVEVGHWEIYEFSAATHVTGDTAGILSGIDANYGAAPELQLHAAFPIAFDKPGGNGMVLRGYGDTEFGFKYRFLTEDEHSWWPQAAIYPAVDFPTGNAAPDREEPVNRRRNLPPDAQCDSRQRSDRV
jgi:hypothetical protein